MNNLVIEVPLDGLADVPAWGWVVGGVLTWYVVVGRAMRRLVRKGRMPADDAAVYWAVSPAVVPMLVAVFVASTVAWAVSGGLVSPMWRWTDEG